MGETMAVIVLTAAAEVVAADTEAMDEARVVGRLAPTGQTVV
jgi:hypothetical protein